MGLPASTSRIRDTISAVICVAAREAVISRKEKGNSDIDIKDLFLCL
jgi:hypothetical protein